MKLKKYFYCFSCLYLSLLMLTGCSTASIDSKKDKKYHCSAIYVLGKPEDDYWRIRQVGDNEIELRRIKTPFAKILFTNDKSEMQEDKENSYFYKSKKGISMIITLLDDSYKEAVNQYADQFYRDDTYIKSIELKKIKKEESHNFNETGYYAFYNLRVQNNLNVKNIESFEGKLAVHYDGKVYSDSLSAQFEDNKMTELSSSPFLGDVEFSSADKMVKNGIIAIDLKYLYYIVDDTNE